MNDDLTRISKFLSLVLRHQPQTIGLSLDEAGWARTDELLEKARQSGVLIDANLLRRVVDENDKRRFVLSEDGTRIRANQGHSIPVDLGLEPMVPPDLLYHGTADRFVDSIRRIGLTSRDRNHVHLSVDAESAAIVGRRHGSPVVLVVNAGAMHREGNAFYLSENGVWLTERIPVKFIVFP